MGGTSGARYALSRLSRANGIDEYQLFLDYADAMTRLPELQASIDEPNSTLDAVQAAELEELTRNVPKLIALLPDLLPDRSDIRYNAAISEMITSLTLRLDQVRPLAVGIVYYIL